jgi:multiple sugar transport system substrate-binding protein
MESDVHTSRTSRRSLLLAALGASSAATLSACAPGGNAAENTPAQQSGDGNLTFWHYYGGQATAPLEALLSKYSEESGVQVTPRLIPFGDFNRTVLQAASASDLPDILLVNAFDTTLFAGSGLLVDLTERATTWGEKEQYFSGPWATTQMEAKTYALPHVADTYALWINQALLPGATPGTWAEVEQIAASVVKPGVSGLAFSGIEGVEGSTAFLLRFLAAGGDLHQIDSPAGVTTLESFQRLLNSGAVSQGMLTWLEDDATTQFQNGAAAMMINSASYLSGLREAGVDLRVAPMPADVEQVSFLSAENLTITRDSANTDAAWELLTWMQKPEVMNEYLPARNKLPVREDTARDAQWSDESIRVFVDQLDVAWAPDADLAPSSAEIFTAVQGAMQAALSGTSSPQEALAQVQQVVDEAQA